MARPPRAFPAASARFQRLRLTRLPNPHRQTRGATMAPGHHPHRRAERGGQRRPRGRMPFGRASRVQFEGGEDRMQPMDWSGMRRRRARGRRKVSVLGAVVVGAALLAAIVAVGAGATATRGVRTESSAPSSSCQLGPGVRHVIELSFDNVHFFRDNPNVPSDLEMMPNLLDFIEGNGTMLSNNHTPL